MNDDGMFVLHIRECLKRIAQYTSGGREAFQTTTLIQDAVLRNLQTLAESTQRLSDSVKSAHSHIDWRGIAGFRNILVHGYLGIDIARVWIIVERDLPELKVVIDSLLPD